MKFPGDNELTLCKEAVQELLATQISATFGGAVRVTSFNLSTYGSELKVQFTSDPEVFAMPPPVTSRPDPVVIEVLADEPF